MKIEFYIKYLFKLQMLSAISLLVSRISC